MFHFHLKMFCKVKSMFFRGTKKWVWWFSLECFSLTSLSHLCKSFFNSSWHRYLKALSQHVQSQASRPEFKSQTARSRKHFAQILREPLTLSFQKSSTCWLTRRGLDGIWKRVLWSWWAMIQDLGLWRLKKYLARGVDGLKTSTN